MNVEDLCLTSSSPLFYIKGYPQRYETAPSTYSPDSPVRSSLPESLVALSWLHNREIHHDLRVCTTGCKKSTKRDAYRLVPTISTM